MSAQFKALRTIIIIVWLYIVFNVLRGYVSLALPYELVIFVIGLTVIWFGFKKQFKV